MDSKGASAIAFAVIVIIAAAVVGINSAQSPSETGDGKAQVNILLVPTTAKVKIGDQEYSSGNYQIDVGDYTATIFADGFNSKDIDLKVVENGEDIVTFYNYLSPSTGSYTEADLERLDLIQHYINGGS
jgi:type 1 fimbria pilin